jgi:hypothetical protein
VRLHDAGIAREDGLGMLAAAVWRIEVDDGGRRRSGEGLIVAHHGPEPTGAALALGEDGHGGLVGMDRIPLSWSNVSDNSRGVRSISRIRGPTGNAEEIPQDDVPVVLPSRHR